MSVEDMDDKLVINTSDRDAKGLQVDPEEKVAVREIVTDVPINMSNGQSVSDYTQGAVKDGHLVHTPTTSIEGTVAEFASGFRGRCRFCTHFNHNLFLKWKADVDASGDIDRRKVLNGLRTQLLGKGYATLIGAHTGPDGDMDVEHALNEFGRCDALESVFNDVVFVWPDAGCPMEDPSGKPFEGYFNPKDNEAQRASDAGYDKILRAAQGGPVKRKATRINLVNMVSKKTED